MSGSTQHIVLSYEKEYSSSQDWDDDFVSHYMGTYTFSGTIDYYIEIQIHLQNVNRGTSDFNYGGNHMDFYRVRLFYPYGGE